MKKRILTLVLVLLTNWLGAGFALSYSPQVPHTDAVPIQVDGCDHVGMSHFGVNQKTSHQTEIQSHVCCQQLALANSAYRWPVLSTTQHYVVAQEHTLYLDVVHGIFKPPKHVF